MGCGCARGQEESTNSEGSLTSSQAEQQLPTGPLEGTGSAVTKPANGRYFSTARALVKKVTSFKILRCTKKQTKKKKPFPKIATLSVT